MNNSSEQSDLALNVIQAALSLAVRNLVAPNNPVSDLDIEEAAQLFDVEEEQADQIMLLYNLLLDCGNRIAAKAEADTLAKLQAAKLLK